MADAKYIHTYTPIKLNFLSLKNKQTKHCRKISSFLVQGFRTTAFKEKKLNLCRFYA